MKAIYAQILGVALGWGWIGSSYAVSLIPVGGYVLPSASATPASLHTSYRASSIWLGGLIDYRMFKNISLETGVLYGARGFNQIIGGEKNSVTFNAMEVPLLMRFQLNSAFSFGIGGYYSHSFGSFHVATDGGTVDTPFSFSTYNADDSGAVASLGIYIPLALKTGLVVDLRYLYGLQEISNYSGISTKLRDIQAFAGVKFGILETSSRSRR